MWCSIYMASSGFEIQFYKSRILHNFLHSFNREEIFNVFISNFAASSFSSSSYCILNFIELSDFGHHFHQSSVLLWCDGDTGKRIGNWLKLVQQLRTSKQNTFHIHPVQFRCETYEYNKAQINGKSERWHEMNWIDFEKEYSLWIGKTMTGKVRQRANRTKLGEIWWNSFQLFSSLSLSLSLPFDIEWTISLFEK